MPVRINQPAVLTKPKPASSATRFVNGAQVKNAPIKKFSPDPKQSKGARKLIRQVFVPSKSGHVPKGEGVSGIIIKMLLENRWTNDDITSTIVKKHGAEAGEIWRNRIAIFRSDINAGRRKAKKVKELHVKLPLIRFQRVGGKLVPAEGRDTRSKKTGLPGGVKNALKPAVRKPVSTQKVPVKK